MELVQAVGPLACRYDSNQRKGLQEIQRDATSYMGPETTPYPTLMWSGLPAKRLDCTIDQKLVPSKPSLSVSLPVLGRFFANLNPEHAKLWHPTRNGGLGPEDVNRFSHKSFWWLCQRCPCGHSHEWQGRVNNLTT